MLDNLRLNQVSRFDAIYVFAAVFRAVASQTAKLQHFLLKFFHILVRVRGTTFVLIDIRLSRVFSRNHEYV